MIARPTKLLLVALWAAAAFGVWPAAVPASGVRAGQADPPHTDTLVSPTPVDFDSTASTAELLESAREMFIADNYVLAEMLYKSVLIREPNNLSAMEELAVVYEALGKLQYAQGLLRRAAILKPYDQELINRNNEVAKKLSATLGAEIDSLMAVGSYKLALPRLSALLTTQPENAELYFQKAQCHVALKDAENALAAIETAIGLKKDPRYFELKSRARSLGLEAEIGALAREVRHCMMTGREEDRERAFVLVNRILDLDPTNEWGQRYLAELTSGEDSNSRSWITDGPVVRIGAHAEHVWNAVVAAVLAIFQTLNDHLDALLYVLIVLIIFGSPLTFLIIRGFAPRQSLSGRLNQFNIQEILTMIQTQNRTGVLKISASTATGRVFFDSGEVYHCTCDGKEGRKALQQLIGKARDGYFVFTNSRRSYPITIDVPLSLILMDLPARQGKGVSNGLPKSSETSLKKRQSRMKELLNNKT